MTRKNTSTKTVSPEAANIIRFGIPSLDRLFGRPEAQQGAEADYGIALDGQSTTICIVGTDGTGKSVLALHLASRYIADSYDPQSASPTNACYISTDLGLPKAKAIWERYRLNRPNARKNPLDNLAGREYPGNSEMEIPLMGGQASVPEEGSMSGELFLGNPPGPQVTFFDLTAAPTGAGWVNRITDRLQHTGEAPKHLLLIDTAECLETMIDEANPDREPTRRNPGEEVGRRAKIAELLRITKRRSHVVFIVEESASDERSPEESVSDVVIRLREVEVDGYQRRTIAIEKLRGQPYVRGQHSISLRSGEGSKTVTNLPPGKKGPRAPNRLYNRDDPPVPIGSQDHAKFQRYVKVYPSLHIRDHRWMRGADEGLFPLQTEEFAGFNVPYLDDLLEHQSDPPKVGLPAGRVTALIGEPGTHKLHLTRSFLAGAFSTVPTQRLLQASDGGLKKICGASILITTADTDAWQLALQLAHLLPSSAGPGSPKPKGEAERLANRILTRIVCRRLDLHDMPAAVLLNIVMSAAEAFLPHVQPPRDLSMPPVRLVLDDIRRWKEIYSDLRRESLFLPALLFNLRRANVTTLIVDSSPGQPETATQAQRETEARSVADIRLYTWRVPFYGESRVAIAAIPPLPVDPSATGPSPARRALVRELRTIPIGGGVERPIVDPHFELYKGIEAGKPEPVALEVCQFSETSQVQTYIDSQNRFLEALFKPFRPTGVIRAVGMDEYKTLRDWCRGQPETQLDHTQLLQVDEFWLPSRSLSLRSQKGYLEARTWSDGESDKVVDPHGIFQPESAGAPSKGPRDRRFQFFDDALGCPFRTEAGSAGCTLSHDVDRVPFTWDFGFLLCDVERWTSAAKHAPETVKKVWDGLPKAWGHVDGGGENEANHKTQPRPSWRAFFGACTEVAKASSAESASRYPPFDVCLHNSESFSCLILEIWMSEILILAGERPSDCKPESVEQWLRAISIRDWAHTGSGRRLLEDPVGLPEGIAKYAFFRTWLLLADILDLDRFGSAAKPFEPVVREANPAAVASRYWYKTACAAQQRPDARVMIAAGLPGSFSARGDWFLGVTRGSRSLRLADRALDFLSSRRANFERMQMGVGLPTRKIARDEDEDDLRVFLKGPRFRKERPLRTSEGAGSVEDKDRWSPTNVSYGSVRRLGKSEDRADFHWLWRSAFGDYDQLNVIWQKSLVRMATAWQALKEDLKPRPGD